MAARRALTLPQSVAGQLPDVPVPSALLLDVVAHEAKAGANGCRAHVRGFALAAA